MASDAPLIHPTAVIDPSATSTIVDTVGSPAVVSRALQTFPPELRARLADTAAAARPCAPATLAEERATNPFLRAPDLAPSLGFSDAEEAFAALRSMKDRF